MAERLVVTGGLLLTGPDWVPRAGDVLVEDGAVVAVGAPGAYARLDARVHDASARLVVPGLVNAHTHSHAMVARGAARRWTLEESLLNGGWMAAERSEELAHLGAVLAATEMVASGGTGAFDLVAQSPVPDPAGLYATARGYADVGMRAVLAPMASDRPVHAAVPVIGDCCGVPTGGADAHRVLAACRTYVEGFPDLPRITPALAPTIPAHCSEELLRGLHALAVRHDLRLHTHLAESKPQAISGRQRFGRSVTAELGRLGVLDDRWTAAHAIWLEPGDAELLAEAGVVAVTVPGSNLRLGSGVADTRALLDAGVRLALGTDGANSADALDVLDAARLTSLVARVLDRPSAQWLGVEETLEAATVGGAAACGWDDVGRIAPGQRADLVLVDLRSRAFVPPRDVANQLLTAARAADVTDVFVDAEHVLADGRPTRVDVDAAVDRFLELATEVDERTRALQARARDEAAAAAAGLARLRTAPWDTPHLLASVHTRSGGVTRGEES